MTAGVAAAVLLAAGFAAVTLAHLRHAGLAAFVLLAPLPGLALIWLAGRLLTAGPLPWAPVWLVCVLSGLLWTDAYLVARLEDADPAGVPRDADRSCAGPLRLAALALLAGAAGSGLLFGQRSLPLMALAMGTTLWPAAMPLRLLARISPGEEYVARLNRTREWELRLVERLLVIARPRWSAALCGIALVFTVLAVFGITDAGTAWNARAMFCAGLFGLFLAAAAYAATRDVRASLAALLVWTLAALMGLWGLAGHSDAAGSVAALLPLLGATSLLLFRAASALRKIGSEGEDAVLAAARIYGREGPGLAAGSLALLFAFGLYAALSGAWALLPACAFAALAPLVLQPAFAIGIETLFPRPETVAARYRLH